MHFFDGVRTAHEVNRIEMLKEDDMRAMLNTDRIIEHGQSALSPDHPLLRGTAQNPDVFFQIRESTNSYYDACPAKVQAAMDKLAEIVGRSYHLFDYVGAPREQEFHQDHRREHRQLRTLALTRRLNDLRTLMYWRT
jgi:pyruvate-ferredoxin/flavodoxin oxidoreductase